MKKRKKLKNELLELSLEFENLIKQSDDKIMKMNRENTNIIFFCTIPTLLRWIFNPTETIFFILGIVFSIIITGCKITECIIYKLEVINNNNLEELKDYILEIQDDYDNHFYESYVLTDYFKDKDYSTKKLKQMNEYLSLFDKNKHNTCFNEVGMRYNYNPIGEVETLQIEKKDDCKVVNDTSLVTKYLEQPLSENQSSISNLQLKPGVFVPENKKVNRNNEYNRIEISIGKVKILTIDRYK